MIPRILLMRLMDKAEGALHDFHGHSGQHHHGAGSLVVIGAIDNHTHHCRYHEQQVERITYGEETVFLRAAVFLAEPFVELPLHLLVGDLLLCVVVLFFHVIVFIS